MKKADVEQVKYFFKIVGVPLGGGEALASANLADEMGLAGEFMAGNVAAIAKIMFALDGLAIHLGQKNVCEGVENVVWCALQQIGNSCEEFAFAKADGVVDVGECEKLD